MPSRSSIIPQVVKNNPVTVRQIDAAPGCKSPALGTYGKLVAPDADAGPDRAGLAVVERFRLQAAARRLLPLEGVSTCLRCRQGGRDTVDIWHLPETSSARFGGLQTCSSVWQCPVCAAKISERKRVEVRTAIDAWTALGPGHDVVLVTLTIRHKAGDRLAWLVQGLKDALKKTRDGKQGAKFASEFFVAGSITGTEVTWSEDNGFHPHLHQLLFVSPGCQFDLLWLHYRKQWSDKLRLSGMREVTSAGVDLRFANADIAEYVNKIGSENTWDLEHELAKSPTKKARKEGHYSPMQLLASFSDWMMAGTGDFEDVGYLHGQVWQEYAHGMKGKSQLHWSRGLRKMLGLVKEKSDAEINEEETDKLGVLLASLGRKEWAVVLHFDARAELWKVARRGSKSELLEYVAELLFALEAETSARIDSSLQVGPSASQEAAAFALRQQERDVTDLLARCDQEEARALDLGISILEYADLQRKLADFNGGQLLEVAPRRVRKVRRRELLENTS